MTQLPIDFEAAIKGAAARCERARVWLWLSHLARTDADAIAYAWPRPEGSEGEMNAADAAAQRFFAKACEVAGGELPEEAWRLAFDAFGRPEGG